MQYVRSLIYTALLFFTVVPYAIWAVLARPFGRAASFVAARAWVDLNFWLLAAICGLRYEITGREHIPELNCVAYLKHSSVWETMAELQIFPQQTWVVKRELKWLPLFGWALAALDPIAINRRAHSSAVRQVIEQGEQRIAGGLWVMIFPEGTRMAPGTTRRYGLSGALLARQTGRPIVPVAHNAGDFWSRRSLLKKPGTIQVVIGPPIATAGREPTAINDDAQAWMELTMRRISPSHR